MPAPVQTSQATTLRIETFEVGPFPNNLYLVLDDRAQELIVVDPSIDSEPALQRTHELIKNGYSLAAIWNTHGHVDHVHDNSRWKEEFKAAIVMHEADDFLLEHLREQSIWLGLPPAEPVMPDARFSDGQVVSVGEHQARVLHVPGHSPGSVAFYFEQQGVCISGDVLFRNSVGRTDLPGADSGQLQDSLRRLLALPSETSVLSGHYEATTVGEESVSNPFCHNLAVR